MMKIAIPLAVAFMLLPSITVADNITYPVDRYYCQLKTLEYLQQFVEQDGRQIACNDGWYFGSDGAAHYVGPGNEMEQGGQCEDSPHFAMISTGNYQRNPKGGGLPWYSSSGTQPYGVKHGYDAIDQGNFRGLIRPVPSMDDLNRMEGLLAFSNTGTTADNIGVFMQSDSFGGHCPPRLYWSAYNTPYYGMVSHQIVFEGDPYPGWVSGYRCGDQITDLFDILETIDHILGLHIGTTGQKPRMDVSNGAPPYCIDFNGNAQIDIFDVLPIIDRALDKPNCICGNGGYCNTCYYDTIYLAASDTTYGDGDINIQLSDTSPAIGSKKNRLEVDLNNPIPIYGLGIHLCSEENIELTGVEFVGRGEEFYGGVSPKRELSDDNMWCYIVEVLYDMGTNVLPAGDGPIMELTFDVPETTPITSETIYVREAYASDSNNDGLTVGVDSGHVFVQNCTSSYDCADASPDYLAPTCQGQVCNYVEKCPDDGLYCNGTEYWVEINQICSHKDTPCLPETCDEENNRCFNCELEGMEPDEDCDMIPDAEDNCIDCVNTDQFDSYPPQGNTIGDACECEGDFDNDGDCDGTDNASFKQDFGRSLYGNPCEQEDQCHGDFDCDGDCDGNDAVIMKQDFGRSSFKNPCPIKPSTGDYCIYPQ